MKIADVVQLFAISLPDRPDRRRDLLRSLERSGIDSSAVRFHAALKPTDTVGFRTAGARGCFLSHLECLELADNRPVLIMEDDLDVSLQFRDLEEEIATRLSRDDWEVAYLSYLDAPSELGTGGDCLKLCSSSTATNGCHFYAVRQPHAYALFLRDVHDRRPMDVDGALNTWRSETRATTLFAVPDLGKQRTSRSDITPSRGDSVRLLRPALGLYRLVRHIYASR